MKGYELPTRRQCLRLMQEYRVPLHIFRHCRKVNKLAFFLARRLKENGVPVDAELVDRASLLHDFVRVCDLEQPNDVDFSRPITGKDKAKWQQIRTRYNNSSHEDAACEILKSRYLVLAETVRKHKYACILDARTGPVTWEEKIVYYADKRVMHDRIVALAERLEEGHRRNADLHTGRTDDRIDTEKVDRLIHILEQEILAKAGLNADEITEELVDSY